MIVLKTFDIANDLVTLQGEYRKFSSADTTTIFPLNQITLLSSTSTNCQLADDDDPGPRLEISMKYDDLMLTGEPKLLDSLFKQLQTILSDRYRV